MTRGLMNSLRKILLGLLPLLIGLLFIGSFGIVEVVIWLVLVVGWLYAFLVWAKQNAPGSESVSG